jgi:tetratricopeptide (TPR) repeat protein
MALLSTRAGMVATATIDRLSGIRDLQISAYVTGGLAAILALVLAAMALRRRHSHPSGRPQPASSSASQIATSTISETRSAVGWLRYLSGRLTTLFAVIAHPAPLAARDTLGAIEALQLAYAYVEEVREADTPTLEEPEVRKHHLNRLALASTQLDAARRLDLDAILEGQDEKGIVYRLSINELEAEALLIEGITLHTYDNKRAVRALHKATALNTNSSYTFYVLGAMHAANMNKGQAVAALQRAVALKPQDLSYRKELDRVQGLSVGEIAAYKATRAHGSILNAIAKAWGFLARRWNNVRFPRRVFLSIYLDILSAYRGGFRLSRPNAKHAGR